MVINTISDAILVDGGTWEEVEIICVKLTDILANKFRSSSRERAITCKKYHGEYYYESQRNIFKDQPMFRAWDYTLSELMAVLPNEITYRNKELTLIITFCADYKEWDIAYGYYDENEVGGLHSTSPISKKHLILAVADALIWCSDNNYLGEK